MSRPVGVVDIGTNSMRLLITDGSGLARRWVEITGLGHGVDATGVLSEDAMERTIHVLENFSGLMSEAGVVRRAAIATSATRDAANGEQFLDWAEIALGVRPELVTGEREGSLAYTGATDALEVQGEVVVCDIGGGSTELITRRVITSVDIGSVRLTDRLLTDRPPSAGQVDAAFDHAGGLLGGIDLGSAESMIGVAGTWTSLGAISNGLAGEEPGQVHGMKLGAGRLDEVFDHLLGLTVEETALLPGLDPRRAPVILAGALIAVVVARSAGFDQMVISERDTLDGMAKEVLALL